MCSGTVIDFCKERTCFESRRHIPYPNKNFRDFTQFLPSNSGIVPRLGYDSFLKIRDYSSFINHPSSRP